MSDVQIPGVGIDFGTTNSCVYFVSQNREETTPIPINGKNFAPTNLTYVEDEEQPIACVYTTNLVYPAGNCIHNIKRIIGKKLNDPDIQKHINKWDFKLVEDNKGMAAFKVVSKNKEIIVTPEQAATLIFKKLLVSFHNTQMANQRTNQIVLTIPVAFNVEQCERIKLAARAAGIDIIATIYEPTAAAISSGMMAATDKKLMIFDFGGGTLDVTIMQVQRGQNGSSVFTTIAETGDPDLGGELIDEILMDHFETVLRDSGFYIRTGPENMRLKNLANLKENCRNLKETLSAAPVVEFFWNGITIEPRKAKLRKNRFETMLIDNKIIDRIKDTVQKCLTKAKYTADKIDNVICVGGSSAIPIVKETLIEMFTENKVLVSTHPEEAIAKGASIYAKAILKGGVSGIDEAGAGTNSHVPRVSAPSDVPARPPPSYPDPTIADAHAYPDPTMAAATPNKPPPSHPKPPQAYVPTPSHPKPPQADVPTPSIQITTKSYLSYSLGYLDAYNDFDEIFENGAEIPSQRTINVSSVDPNQPNMITKVCYRKDDEDDSIILSTYTVDYKGNRGDKVSETWSIDAGGNLTIKSVLFKSGASVSNKVSISNLYFTTDEINQMRRNADEFESSLNMEERIQEVEKQIDAELSRARRLFRSSPRMREVKRKLDEIVNWVDEGRAGRTENEYKEKLQAIRGIIENYSS